LSEITAGGAALAFDAGARPAHHDGRVVFDRGSVDEVYVVEPGSIEQQFVLESVPTRGEVVVRLAVETALAGSTVADGFDFSCEWGRVHYGRATAIDAAGRELALESALDGGAIEIRVPADFVASAELPLVIDPVVTSFAAEMGSITSLSPDISHAIGGYLLLSWEEIYNATDHDVYAVLSDGAGNLSYGGYIDYTTTYWAHPRSAHLYVGDRFLVAAEVGDPSGAARTVWGVVRDAFLGFSSAQFQISEPGAFGEQLHPDVGADPYPFAPSYFCVVWERVYAANDRDVHARLFDENGAPATGTIYVDNSAVTLDTEPVISKTNDGSTWNIAWQREAAPGDHDIWGARMSWSGSVSSPPFPISTYYGFDEANPAVCGPIQGTSRYLVAFTGDYGTDRDVLLSLLDGSTSLAGFYDLSVAEGAYYLQDQIEPALDSNGRHFNCSYSELYSTSTVDYDLYTVELLPVGNSLQLREPHTNISFSPAPDRAAQIVCHESGDWNTTSVTYWTIWNALDLTLGASDNCYVAGYVGIEGGPVSYFCGGTPSNCPCGNGPSNGAGCSNSYNASGAYLVASGAASTAADSLTMYYGGMPPLRSALLFQGQSLINFGYGNPFGDGLRCTGAPVYRFPVRMSDATGAAAYGYAIGDTPISWVAGVPFYGGTFYYQVWYRDTAPFCTAAGTNFTNAANVTWTP
jgi:hypothetical protein